MRRCATSERTMTPAKTSTGLVQVIPRLAGKHDHRARVVSATLTSCDGASATPCRWRVQKCKLDNKSQLKGRMTAYYAVTTHTPSEMVKSRANADHPNMGLRVSTTQADVEISKNYLAEGEIKEFNRLTTILLDVFEDQLDVGRLTTMAQAETLLDNQLCSFNRQVLRGGGSVKTAQAKAYALEQYKVFNAKRKAVRHAEADQALAALKAQEKLLPKSPRKKRTSP
jgi:hypothetical protein